LHSQIVLPCHTYIQINRCAPITYHDTEESDEGGSEIIHVEVDVRVWDLVVRMDGQILPAYKSSKVSISNRCIHIHKDEDRE
jgi:hypothetical protein